MRGRTSKWSLGPVLALALTLGLSGCGDDDDPGGLGSADPTASASPSDSEEPPATETPTPSEPTEATPEATTQAPPPRPSRNAADAPNDATPAAYCREWARTVRALDAVEDLDEPGFDQIIDRLDDLEVVGTPAAIPAPYRRAFELFVSLLDHLVWEEGLELDGDIPGSTTTPGEDELIEEFTDWSFEFCES